MCSNREWSGGFMRKVSISAFVALVLAFPFHASAARVQGLFSGVFSGNDSVASLATNLSLDPALLSQLAKVDWPSVSEDGLAISNLTLNEDDEAIAGDWDYSGSGTVRYFVVKAGPQYAVYEYTTAITGGSTNLGFWDTSELGNKGVSHVTAYSYVPEPTTALMLGLGLIGLGWMRRGPSERQG